jgi:prepilin-type N-terminal cleavage/methylation domain-containing protein
VIAADGPVVRRGVTLLELAIVLAVLGIVAGLAVPAFVDIVPRDASTPADSLLGVLRAARRAAADSGRRVLLLVDPASRRYVAELDGADAPLAEGTVAVPPGTTMRADSTIARFAFAPDGIALGADSMTVSGDGGRTALVTVDPWTGEPRARAR